MRFLPRFICHDFRVRDARVHLPHVPMRHPSEFLRRRKWRAPRGEYFGLDTTSSVWAYWILEIMASVTSLEYVFTKAPTNMRSTVQAVALFMNALSSALAQALVALAEDPLLVWNYGLVSVLAAAGGVLSWLDNRKLDREEDKLNLLPSAQFHAKMRALSDEESGDRVVEEVGSE
jgi:hypothetical protein